MFAAPVPADPCPRSPFMFHHVSMPHGRCLYCGDERRKTSDFEQATSKILSMLAGSSPPGSQPPQ